MTTYEIKANFTKGEVTPLVFARQDTELYKSSLESLVNFCVLKHGGIRRRSGTVFMGEAKYHDRPCRIFAYTFSNGQSYVLEFGDLYLRVWTSQGPVVVGATPVEIATPYAWSDVEQLQFAVANDQIFIAHPSYHPRVVSRSAHTVWSIGAVEFNDGPWEPINEDRAAELTVTGSPTSNTNVQFDWATGVALNGATDLNRQVRAMFRGRWVWGRMIAILSPTSATVQIIDGADDEDLDDKFDDDSDGSKTDPDDDIVPSGEKSKTWRFGAITANDSNRWPGAVALFEGRIVWGRTNVMPRGVFASMSNSVKKYSPSKPDGTVTDDSGFTYNILAGRADPILWLKEAPRLQIGTASSIRTLGSADSTPLTPSNVAQRIEIYEGAAQAQPEQAGPSTIFIGRGGARLHDLFYDYQVNGLRAPDISILSDHLFDAGAKRSAWQNTPDNILWFITHDGKLNGMTFQRDERVLGYHTHDIANAFVEGLCVTNDTLRDELVIVTKRVIGGADKRYFERLAPQFERDAKEDAYFVDCGVTYTGAPTSVVSGLLWLAGEEVSLLADGYVLPNTTVSALGVVTLPNSAVASTIHIGLPVSASALTMRASVIAPDGATLGRRKRVHRAIVDVYETLGLKVGPAPDPTDSYLERLRMRPGNSPMNASPALFTGTESVAIDDTWDGEAQIRIVCDQPLPATIRALSVSVSTEP